jgi:hypothetical protein
MPRLKIEGYVIVSADGMLADAAGAMPASLMFRGDKAFLFAGLGLADLVVSSRHSIEEDEGARRRKRLIVTRRTDALAADPDNTRAVLWNPAGASFEDACSFIGVQSGTAAILGGPEVFALFLDRYDTFFLSQAKRLVIPDGRGCFPDVPARTPQQVLAAHGLTAGLPRILDEQNEVSVTPFMRGLKAHISA